MTKEAVDAACRKSFSAFAAKAFKIIEPGTFYEYNWHIDCIAEHLQAAYEGQLPKLIINMPPRSLKSYLVSVAFPAWLLGKAAHEKIITASYSHDLAKEMSSKCRHIVKSEWYQSIFPATQLDLAQNQKHHWETTQRGQYYATSSMGSVTGIGCNYLVIDDGIKPMEAQSESIRNSTNENIRATLFSRFNDPRTSRFIMVMQRLHENDPTGNLLSDGGYHLLKLPAETKVPVQISLNGTNWNMKAGELLFPARLSQEILDQKRLDMTEYHYAGQMLQEPVPAGGGEFKEEWPQYYHGELKYKTMNIVILVDAAGGDEVNKKKKKTSDWTAMMVIGLAPDNNYYLLDVVRDRLNPTERIDKLFDLHREWNIKGGKPPKVGYEKYGMMTDTHYIEKKKREEGYNFSLVELGGRMIKEERIRRLIPDLQQNRWYYPRNLWYTDCENRKIDLVRELIYSEMASFPRAKFDDMLDAKSRIYDMEIRFPALKKKKRTIVEEQGWIGA